MSCQTCRFHGVSPNLEWLLRSYKKEGGEGHKALYKHLFGLLRVSNLAIYLHVCHEEVFSYINYGNYSCDVQYGSYKTLEAIDGWAPTYVYPSAVKAVVRTRFPADVRLG